MTNNISPKLLVLFYPFLVIVLVSLACSACAGGGDYEPSPSIEKPDKVVPPSTGSDGEETLSLSPSVPPRFGSESLEAPFDLFLLKDVVSGGDVDVSNMKNAINENECDGFITPEPSVRLEWSGSDNLGIFFIPDDGEGDTMLALNDADGNWHCNDDSFDTPHPKIDITDATKGVYNIWVGSFDESEEISGTIYITTQTVALTTYAQAYFRRGNSYAAQGEYELAIADFTKAIELEPNSAYAYKRRGLVYTDKDEYELAIADYQRALKISSLSDEDRQEIEQRLQELESE